ncbi:hypothetical protein ABFX02_03G048200 [Erythranthe guttata]
MNSSMAKCFLFWVLVIFYLNLVCVPISGRICELGLDVLSCNPNGCNQLCVERVPKDSQITQTQCRVNPITGFTWCYCYYQCK